MASGEKQLTIQYRASADTLRGQLINYVQNLPGDHKEACRNVIDSWYLPFSLDVESSSDRALALQCMESLTGQARAIQKRFGFTPSVPITQSIASVGADGNSNRYSEPVEGEEREAVNPSIAATDELL